jgi:hypothetical protein
MNRRREPFSNIHDNKRFAISARKLKRWHKKMRQINDMRIAIRHLPVDRATRMALVAILAQIDENVQVLKGEMEDKLRNGAEART